MNENSMEDKFLEYHRDTYLNQLVREPKRLGEKQLS